jgi:PleD family two-component response regulator
MNPEHKRILLDLSLPDGSGLDTVVRICATNPHMPVIVLTGLEDDALSLTAVQAGAQDYLVKEQVDGSGIARAMEITASIGISLYPCDGEETESLLKYADIAMYCAKRDRDKVCFYHECKGDL